MGLQLQFRGSGAFQGSLKRFFTGFQGVFSDISRSFFLGSEVFQRVSKNLKWFPWVFSGVLEGPRDISEGFWRLQWFS